MTRPRSVGGHVLFAAVMAVELTFAWVRFLAVGFPLGLLLWIGPHDEARAETIATWVGGAAGSRCRWRPRSPTQACPAAAG